MASLGKPTNTDVPEKYVFALHFLQTLSSLTTQNLCTSPEKRKDRVKKIKKAAYVSMAKVAGGSNRIWSRALLRRAAKGNNKNLRLRKKKVTCKRRRRGSRRAPVEAAAAERLRNLVPGGGGMETSKLMEETAHYIKCLSIQVKVMQCIVDGLSPK